LKKKTTNRKQNNI